MTVQSLDFSATIVNIAAPSSSFQAVTVAVNQEQGKIVFGALDNGQSIIYSFDVVDQETVVLTGIMEVDGRITSIASQSGVLSYVIEGGSSIASFALDQMTTPSPTSTVPTMSPPPMDSSTSGGGASNTFAVSSFGLVSLMLLTLLTC